MEEESCPSDPSKNHDEGMQEGSEHQAHSSQSLSDISQEDDSLISAEDESRLHGSNEISSQIVGEESEPVQDLKESFWQIQGKISELIENLLEFEDDQQHKQGFARISK